jgi:hypothetical protein
MVIANAAAMGAHPLNWQALHALDGEESALAPASLLRSVCGF